MHIVIDVAAYYDWESTDETPEAADILALKYKPALNGKWLKKKEVKEASHTTITIPEAQLQDLVEHYERIGSPKSRERVVAWMLEEKVMPHHSHPDHFIKVAVHDEPEVEKFLNRYFMTDAQ